MEKAGTADEKTTVMSYLGVDSSLASEHVDGSLARTYQYGGQGERLAMVKHTGSVEYSVYGYDTRGNVEVLTNDSGIARATYGYTAYGSPDKDLMTGVDKPDPANPDKEPYNTFRYGAKQLDPATGNYDMGARDYSPGLNRFLSRDLYAGALSDLGLATDPFTMNRYAFGGGNPLSRIEMDGHWGWSDIGHAVLDVVGLVPVVGEAADLANAAWYLAEGNYADAALSAAGAIPFVGWGATAVKTGKNVYKGVDALRSGSKGLDEAADALNATRKADAPPVKDPDQPSTPKDQPGSDPAPKPTQQPAPVKPKPAPDPAPATPKPAEVGVDANSVIGALDYGQLGKLDNALAGRAPVVSPQAAAEYLRKGSADKLNDFLAQRGGRIGSQATEAEAEALRKQARPDEGPVRQRACARRGGLQGCRLGHARQGPADHQRQAGDWVLAAAGISGREVGVSSYNTVVLPRQERCPRCGSLIRRRVQFKYGDTWQHDYQVGDRIAWGGNDVGVPARRVRVLGYPEECPVCDHDLGGVFDVLVTNGVIEDVVPSTTEPYIAADHASYLVLEP